MKSKSTLRAFLALAGTTLFTLTCGSAGTYYWDANDGTAGFQDEIPPVAGPAGTWSAATPSTATGGFTTDSTGATVISANPAVGTTIDDDIFFGTGSTTDVPPLYPFTGTITIDGTVNARSVYQSANSPGFSGINSPTVNFPAEGSWEHATTGTVSLPALVITGASTSMTWKMGFSNNLNIQNITSNGAARNILTGPGRLVVNNTLNLGAAGTPFVFDGGVLRMNTGILWTKMSELNADHPVSFTLDKNFGIDRRHASSFEIDNPLNLGTGGLSIEGNGTAIDIILSQDYQYSGPTTLSSGSTSVETTGNLGLPASNLVFNGGTLKIRGTTLTSFSTIGHTVVFNTDKFVGLNIAQAGHTFTADQALNQGTGALTKSGPGTLTLSGTNTYTGVTTVASDNTNGGIVNVSGDQSAATGGWTINGDSTVNFLGGSTIVVGAGKKINLINSKSSANFALNVYGKVTTSVTEVRGRRVLNLESGADWTQNSNLIIQPLNTSYDATMNVKTGSSFTYSGAADIVLAKSSSGASGDATVNLSGGTFTTAKGFSNTNAGTGSGATRLQFSNGGTLKLSADIASLIIQKDATNAPFSVSTNNAAGGVIDTNTFNTTIGVAISGTGGLTKAGDGTLTLSGTNTYAGDTAVTGGTLSLAADNTSNDLSTVTIGSSGVLQLTFAGTDTVDKLFIGATQQPKGVYGHSSTGATNGGLGVGALDARFAEGSGTLTVVSDPPSGTPFQAFMAGYPELTGDNALPGADPDADGLSNIAEFIMGGTAPNSGSAAERPVEAVTSGYLTYSMLVPSGATFAGSPSPSTTVQGVQVAVGGSLDLATFTRTVEETVLNPGLPGVPSGYEWHTFRLGDPISGQSRGFLRASFSNP